MHKGTIHKDLYMGISRHRDAYNGGIHTGTSAHIVRYKSAYIEEHKGRFTPANIKG